MRKFTRTIALAGFIFGLLGWIYIAGNAWFHPETLYLPLTHLAMWPREDTFGIICFVTSLVGFLIWHLLRD